MIGASISRWTMSYFATALAWLFVALAMMVAGFGYPAADVASPDTLVLVHVVCIGWLSLAMCGALFQFVPVSSQSRCSRRVGVAGAGPADRRSRRAARGLPGIGRPASRPGLASSDRRSPAHCRVRPCRCRSRVDGMAPAGGSCTFRSGRVGFALCHCSLRRDLRVCACGLGGTGRRSGFWQSAFRCTRSPGSAVG